MKNKNIIGFIIMAILMIVVIIILNVNKDRCIKNGGKVVTDSLGMYEKCIYD